MVAALAFLLGSSSLGAHPPDGRSEAQVASCIADDTVALDPAAAPLHLGAQSYAQTLRLCDHRVVLTFDDGPSPGTTPLILDALKQAGVKATFFLIGRNACLYPKLARREAVEGHTLGHHSNTHPSFTLRGFDQASAERDIANGIAADERVIYGADARPDHPHVPFFRFPGFADTGALLRHLDDRHVAVFGSDLWAGDWIVMSPEHERERVVALLERRPLHNGIILFHDTRPSTARMLPDLLRELKAKGYHFVQPIYVPGAPVPPLTAPLKGEPETETIIAHLRPPIVPDAHRLAGREAMACAAPDEGSGDLGKLGAAAGTNGEVSRPLIRPSGPFSHKGRRGLRHQGFGGLRPSASRIQVLSAKAT